MPRPRRIAGAGLTYHVYARGNNGEAIFREDADRRRYLATIAESSSKYACRLFAYVLMTNHVHIVIQTARPSISKMMWFVQGHHATFLNRKYGRYGHLFASRFHSRVIKTNEYLLQCTCYIHLNPVHAGLVRNPEDYAWSTYRNYAHEERGESFLDVAPVLGLLATSRSQAREAYVAFVEQVSFDRRLVLDPPHLSAIRDGEGAIRGIREPTSGP